MAFVFLLIPMSLCSSDSDTRKNPKDFRVVAHMPVNVSNLGNVTKLEGRVAELELLVQQACQKGDKKSYLLCLIKAQTRLEAAQKAAAIEAGKKCRSCVDNK